MKDLFLLFKYSSKNRVKKKNVHFFNNNYFAFIIQYIIFSSISGVLFYKMLSISNVSIYGVRLSDIISGIYILVFSFLFFFNYTPFISLNLYDNQFIPFYLTLPIKKSTIFFYTSLDTLIYAGFSLSFIFPFSIIFPILYKTNIFLSILAFLFFTLIVISISNILSILLVFFISKTASRILGTISYLFIFLGFFLITSQSTLSPEKIKDFTGILKIKNLIYFPLSPLAWFLKTVNGKYLYLLYLVAFAIILSYFSLKIPINIDFSFPRKRTKGKKISLKESNLFSPFLIKDINIIRRDAASTYILLFAILYPVFLYITSKNTYTFLIIFAALNSFYCSLVSINLYSQEKRVYPLTNVFPLKDKDIIKTKIIIPTFTFFIIYVMISLFLIKINKYLILFSPIIFVLNLFDAVLALYFLTRNPSRDYSQKNVLSPQEFLFLEIISLIVTLIIILLPFLYIVHIKGPFQFSFINKIESVFFLSSFIFFFIPSFSFLLIIYFSIKMFNSLKI